MTHGTQQAIVRVIGKSMSKNWRCHSGLRARITDRTAERIQKQNDRGMSNQANTHQLRANGEHQSIEQKVALEKGRNLCYQHDPRHVDVVVKDFGL